MLMIAGTDALSLVPLLAASLPCVPSFSREIYYNRLTRLAPPPFALAWRQQLTQHMAGFRHAPGWGDQLSPDMSVINLATQHLPASASCV